MKVLLDTNVYSALRKGHASCVTLVRRATEVVLSSIVAGELLHGFRRGDRYAANLALLERFLLNPNVSLAEVQLSTSHRFGEIAAQLSQAGTPIPTNDVWLAAQTFELGATLVSFDQHFARVDSLAWIDPGCLPT